MCTWGAPEHRSAGTGPVDCSSTYKYTYKEIRIGLPVCGGGVVRYTVTIDNHGYLLLRFENGGRGKVPDCWPDPTFPGPMNRRLLRVSELRTKSLYSSGRHKWLPVVEINGHDRGTDKWPLSMSATFRENPVAQINGLAAQINGHLFFDFRPALQGGKGAVA